MSQWKRIIPVLMLLFAGTLVAPGDVAAGEPDYSTWNEILARYYSPAHGMKYSELQRNDAAKLRRLRAEMSRVEPSKLTRDEQLAFWINFYNISVVGIVVDHYPVESIRDISTDPIIRLNVFKKDRINFQGKMISLDYIEHEKVRKFGDPRIHFAINCAAASCPPIRTEAFVAARLNDQLDDQTKKFLNGPNGIRVERKGSAAQITTTKIMDWFEEDFEKWGGGNIAFIRGHLETETARALEGALRFSIEYADYDWSLNDWK